MSSADLFTEQYKLVKEALRERKIFLETAPHLSSMLPLVHFFVRTHVS